MELMMLKEFYTSFMIKAAFLLLISWWMRWIWSRRRLYTTSRMIPGPSALPILGNAIQMGIISQHRKILENIKGMMKIYGGFFRIWFGPVFMVCFTEAKDFECILTNRTTYNKGFMYDMLKYVMSDGLLVSSGNFWKKHRHIINPAFAISTIKKYQKNHNYYATKMIQSMNDVTDKGIVDVSIYAARYSADTVCNSLYEFKPNFSTGEHDGLLRIIQRGISLTHERICKFWLHSDFIYEKSETYKEFSRLYEIYTNFFHPRLSKTIQDYVDQAKSNNLKIEEIGSYDNLDADYILEENNNVKNKSITNVLAEGYMSGDLTLQDVFNEFHNTYHPATDTIYAQLSAFMLMMGMHKRVQDKLWCEIKDFYANDLDAEVTNEHFSHLPYLDMAVKETIRHFPTAPMQMRKLEEDFYLKSRDITLPAGTQILLLNIILHKNEKYWKNPLDFYPERFSPEESAKRPFFAYVPFSIGLRNCIGQVFGTDSIKTGAIHLIRNFEFTADASNTMEKISYITDVSTRNEFGYNVKVTRRNRSVHLNN